MDVSRGGHEPSPAAAALSGLGLAEVAAPHALGLVPAGAGPGEVVTVVGWLVTLLPCTHPTSICFPPQTTPTVSLDSPSAPAPPGLTAHYPTLSREG